MQFSWSKLIYPVIMCAPMDGITDFAFREIISMFGGCDVLYTEFTHVNGIINGGDNVINSKLKYSKRQKPVILQLFGSRPEDFFAASQIVSNLGFDAIDINMGCPAHKVTLAGGGCALMNDIDRAIEIVKKTNQGANLNRSVGEKLEVSIKTRLGIKDKETIFKFGIEMIKAGASAIAIHGRTLLQMYSGVADWSYIKKFVQIKNELINSNKKISVFGSGDLKNLFDVFIMILYSGVDGVMIGRGVLGKPWIFSKEKVNKLKELIDDVVNRYHKPCGEFELDDIYNLDNIELIKKELQLESKNYKEIADIAILHAEIMFNDRGEKGIIEMRKHLGWYFVGFDGAKELRNKLVRVTSLNEIKKILEKYL